MELRLMPQAAPLAVACRYDTRAVCGSFFDEEYVFHYIESGVCEFRIEGKIYHLGAGHAILLPPNVPHALRTAAQGQACLFVVAFSYGFNAPLGPELPLVVKLDDSDQKRLSDIFFSMLQELGDKRKGHEMLVSGMLMEMLSLHVRNSGMEPSHSLASPKVWRKIEDSIRLMNKEFKRRWSVSQLSSRAGLSPAYFCRAFQDYTGWPPLKFMNNLRVEKAKPLLLAGDLNCSEIAERVGFSSLHQFSKVFRRFVGSPPVEWVRECLSPMSRIGKP